MPNLNDLEEMPRRELNIFYVLDTSGSMSGQPISQLNTAMTEIQRVLSDLAADNADALLKVSVLEFNTTCQWMNPTGPQEATDFLYQDLIAGGTTELGSALKELNDKLSKDKFLKSSTGAYLPIIIFMTDGEPTDSYMDNLKVIRENRWYKKATKIGFAIGDADREAIAEVVGNSEAVIQTTDLQVFAKMIKFASTTASMLCSASHTSTNTVTGADIVSQVVGELDDNEKSTVTIDTDYQVDNLPDDDDWGDDDWD